MLARAPLHVTVDEHGAARLVPAGDSLAARVAGVLADALVEGTWLRLKACQRHRPATGRATTAPAGRGRWCSMSVCGARAKMRRYRAK